MKRLITFILCVWPAIGWASDRLNIIDYAPPGTKVDRDGGGDASPALNNAIAAANNLTERGKPACVYIPPGIYRIVSNPPTFARAGCVVGDGPSQSILSLDPSFKGDLFTWSEAWAVTTPGPMVVGLKIQGTKSAMSIQNAFVFYDRNDEVFIDNVAVTGVHGRALYSGVTRHANRAYMRESHMRSLWFFDDGAPNIPVVEFNSEGVGNTDATNEIRMSQVDIYGAHGPGFVIRNAGSGSIRDITIEGLRIEGTEDGATAADLLTIGDPLLSGNVNNIRLMDLELIDPYKGFAALRITAPTAEASPYQITVSGSINGGAPHGQGLRIDAGRDSVFRWSGIHTNETNIIIGRGVTGIVLDGGGQEGSWTYSLDPTAITSIHFPGYFTPPSSSLHHAER